MREQNSVTVGAHTFQIVRVGGLPFCVTDLEHAVNALLEEAAAHRKLVHFRLANAYCVALADEDANYRAVLAGPGVNLPDGLPVTWVMNSRLRMTKRRAE